MVAHMAAMGRTDMTVNPNFRSDCWVSVYKGPDYSHCRVHHEKHWVGRNTSWNQDFEEKYQ